MAEITNLKDDNLLTIKIGAVNYGILIYQQKWPSPIYSIIVPIIIILLLKQTGAFLPASCHKIRNLVLSQKKKYRYASQFRPLMACCMMFLLLLLTTANFLFYFSQADDTSIISVMVDDDDPDTFPGSPSGPDEKAPGGPVSIAEEFLHAHEDDYLPLIPEGLFTHVIAESEKVELIHFELLSPPPEC